MTAPDRQRVDELAGVIEEHYATRRTGHVGDHAREIAELLLDHLAGPAAVDEAQTAFHPATGCMVEGSDGWCVAVTGCVTACQYPHNSVVVVELAAELKGQPSTSARLRQAQKDLAASQADLTRVERERDEIAHDRDHVAVERDRLAHQLAEARADNGMTRVSLAAAEKERDRADECRRDADRAALEVAKQLTAAKAELARLRAAQNPHSMPMKGKSMTTSKTGVFGPGRNFSAEVTGPGRGTVKIDGHDISNAIRGFQISAGIHDVTAVTLDLGIIETTRIDAPHTEVAMSGLTRQLLLDAGWTAPEDGDA